MNKQPALTLVAAALVTIPAYAQNNPQQQCLALKNLKIAATAISKAEWSKGEIAADAMSAFTGGSTSAQQAKPHCVVEGEIGARTGADGKHYGTRFQLRLPEAWNKRFLFQGGGGVDGFIAPAVGNIPVNTTTATPVTTSTTNHSTPHPSPPTPPPATTTTPPPPHHHHHT